MRDAARILAVVAVAVAAGCGDDSDDSPEPARTTTTTTGDAAEYRRELNKLCREDYRAGERLGREITSDEDLVPYLRKALALSRKRRPLYEALEPPADLRNQDERSLEVGRQIEGELASTVRRVEAGGEPAQEFQRMLPRVARGIDESNRLARRIGAKDCVVEGLAPGVAPQARTS